MKIILASGSPRRSDLMQMAGFTFEVRVKNTPETHPEGVIVAADTIVVLNGKIFEKPQHREEAVVMLTALSGQTHKVVTGVCLLSKEKKITFREETNVTFNALSASEIANYVDTYKPYDKAGAYACQEWIGAVAIAKFEGDYFNVVGLPINKVYRYLKEFGINN
jgi:septum formation protein